MFAIDELSVIKTPVGGEHNRQELEVERKILERLGQHPRIVRLLYIHRDMVVLERLMYPPQARIAELQDEKLVPRSEDILKWSAQAAEGMHYFHGKNVFQVDIGLHNLLLDWDENVKYCDFSGSSIDGAVPLNAVGSHAQHPTIPFDSPSVQSEIFSLGCAIFEMSTTRKTYDELDEREFEQRFSKGDYPDTRSLLLGRIIANCWSGEYGDAGLVAGEIRAIQRRHKMGDMTLSLRAHMQKKEGAPTSSPR